MGSQAQPRRDEPAALLASLGCEVLDVLWSFYLLREQPQEPTSTLEGLKTTKFLSLLTDDIVLRLCKLRDKDPRAVSFESAAKRLGRIPLLAQPLEDYRKLTDSLKEHRDKRIAHREQCRPQLEPLVQLLEAVRLAARIVDLLQGQHNTYAVEGLNLRREVLGE